MRSCPPPTHHFGACHSPGPCRRLFEPPGYGKGRGRAGCNFKSDAPSPPVHAAVAAAWQTHITHANQQGCTKWNPFGHYT